MHATKRSLRRSKHDLKSVVEVVWNGTLSCWYDDQSHFATDSFSACDLSPLTWSCFCVVACRCRWWNHGFFLLRFSLSPQKTQLLFTLKWHPFLPKPSSIFFSISSYLGSSLVRGLAFLQRNLWVGDRILWENSRRISYLPNGAN